MIIEDGSLLMTVLDRVYDLCARPVRINAGEASFTLMPSVKHEILVHASLRNTDGFPQNLVPCLLHCLGFRMSDKAGSVFAEYSGSHFSVQFYTAEKSKDYVSFCIEAVTLKATLETLRQLDGKKLVIKRVAIGRPNPRSKWNRLMLAE